MTCSLKSIENICEGYVMNEEKPGAETVLHLTDITDLLYIADEAVMTALEHDSRLTNYGEFVEKTEYTREYAASELRHMRGKGDPVFRVENGMWLGKTLRERVFVDFPEDIRECFLPKQDIICHLMRCIANWHGQAFGEDVTDEYLLSLFSARWYAMLVQVEQLDDWNRKHHLPCSVPGGSDQWYVDLGDRIEIGPLEYVVSEYCGDGLFYRYEDGIEDSPHAHSFQEVLQEALEHPETFSIDRHEDCYSEQERRILRTFVAKLKADAKRDQPQQV